MEENQKIPMRSQVKKEDTWAIEDMYATVEDWEKDFAAAKKVAEEAAEYAGRLGESAQALYDWSALTEKLDCMLSEIYGYASRVKDQDTADAAGQTLSARAMGLYVECSGLISFADPEILSIPEEKLEVPIYRETANYAYEAGEMDAYRASLAANEECRRAIEAAISSNYGDNRLDADAAVKSVLEQFSPERVRYVLANTIQQKDFDGRIPQPLKEWAKSVEVCPENASRFLVDKPNPGLTALFVDAFRQQTEPQKEAVSEKTEERDPEVVAWENDEITSIEVKTVEVKSPFAPLPEEAAKAPKAHRLTAEEKEIKAAVMDTLKGQIAYNNDGMRASYRASNHSFNLLARNGVRIEGNTVTQNGEPLFKIHRRHAARKTQGCYRELMPTLEYVKQEQKQEKPSIRDQLRTAAKQQPEKKSPVKSKTHDMEL